MSIVSSILSDLHDPFKDQLPAQPNTTEGQDFLRQLSNTEQPDPSQKGTRALWYPLAKVYPQKMKTRGKYPNGYPEGAVVHFTAGVDGTGALEQGIVNGFSYFLITRDGTVWQAAPLDEWGFHAGPSTYPGLGNGISPKLVGIEMCTAGIVDPQPVVAGQAPMFKQWYERDPRKYLSAAEVRYSVKKDNIHSGYYHIYTPAQEHSLVGLLLWLKSNNPGVFSFDHVLGHDEICVPPGRKVDPGAALTMSMPEFRAFLKTQGPV